jgi:hypothetical protein
MELEERVAGAIDGLPAAAVLDDERALQTGVWQDPSPTSRVRAD